MTKEEFQEESYSNKTMVLWNDAEWFVGSVDFGEGLFGLVHDIKDEDEEMQWARYENCTIINPPFTNHP